MERKDRSGDDAELEIEEMEVDEEATGQGEATGLDDPQSICWRR